MTHRHRNDGRALLCWSLLCAPLIAQDNPKPGEVTIPGVNLPTDPKKDDEKPIIRSSEVRVTEFGTCDIIVQNDDINNVLSKLAVQSRRNIIPSAGVSRPVNATMYGVTFESALDALLTPNGLAWEADGDFVFVYTTAELAAHRSSPNNLLSKRIMLDYLRSEDALEFASPLLSESGKITATKDSGGGGGGGAADAAAGGASGATGGGSDDSSIYTPETDEYALENAVVIHDVKENVDRIEAFLKLIDTQPEQVLLECTILESSIAENNAFGVDFAMLDDTQMSTFLGFGPEFAGGAVSPVTGNLNRNFAVGTPGNAAQGDATLRVGLTSGDDLGVFIRALDTIQDITVLSNPKVLALNRQRTKVMVGTRVAYLETTVVENQVLQTIKFIDTGITLEVRPYVLKDRRVRMEIYPKVSDVDFRPVVGQGGISQDLPDENVRTVQTDILVPQGSTAVIGGLFREDTDRARKQVPIVGDIPLIGAVFEGQDDELKRVEVIFLIKPTVMTEHVLLKQGDEGLDYYEQVRVGSRLGLLPWSRERQSAYWNLKAQQAARVGAYEQARFYISCSLQLHPQQPEILRLQDQLKEKDTWLTRSMLERIIDEEIDLEFPDAARQKIEESSSPKTEETPAEPAADTPPSGGAAPTTPSNDHGDGGN